MAVRFYLDASALAKRYVVEPGTPVVNHLFSRVARDAMACLKLGTLEVISIFVRKKNAQGITPALFQQALTDFRAEVLDAADFPKAVLTDAVLNAAIPLLDRHSINSNDAVVLRSAMDFADTLRAAGYNLVLVASDQRLLRAARAEGLATFNPETQSQADLDTLLAP